MSHTFHVDGEQYVIPPSFFRVSIKLLVRNHENKALLVKDHLQTWCLPGGGWDYGETFDQCIRREIGEELGVGIKSYNPQPVGFWDGKSSKGDYRSLKIVLAGELDSTDFIVTDEAVEVGYFSYEQMTTMSFTDDEKGVVELCRDDI